ncbi:hypothetical protein ACEWY4_005285 [Coilia grayii]|uniref:Saposin B-type domain-containing protein n=1 Tax=Coilia grayii TaxID=363190 RepID=A0ABD1KI35_9TELE
MGGRSPALFLGILVILLTCLVWTSHGDGGVEKIVSDTDASIPGACRVCTWVVKKIRRNLPNGGSKEEIKERLEAVCNRSFLKRVCLWFVRKFLNKLPDEISSKDDARTICVHLKACRG